MIASRNLEVVQELWKEFQAGMDHGDPGAWFDSHLVADDYEWILTTPLEGRSVWRGRDGFVAFLRTWTAEFDDWSIDVERWVDAGAERVVALTRQTGTGKESGVPVELRLGMIWEFDRNRLARARVYLSYAEALEAAGLSK